MKQYLALCHIDRGTEQFNAGEQLALPDDTAERLLAMDPPAIARVESSAPPAPPAGQKVPPVARLNVEKTIERIKATADVAALLAIQEEEHAHPDGPRKGVISAIEARFDAFAADDTKDAKDGGDGNDDGEAAD